MNRSSSSQFYSGLLHQVRGAPLMLTRLMEALNFDVSLCALVRDSGLSMVRMTHRVTAHHDAARQGEHH